MLPLQPSTKQLCIVTVNTDNNENCIAGSESAAETTVQNVDEVIDQAVNMILEKVAVETNSEESKTEVDKDEQDREEQRMQDREQRIQRIRKGWTISECGTLSIGELYLMVNVLSIFKTNFFFCTYRVLLVWNRFKVNTRVQLGFPVWRGGFKRTSDNITEAAIHRQASVSKKYCALSMWPCVWDDEQNVDDLKEQKYGCQGKDGW